MRTPGSTGFLAGLCAGLVPGFTALALWSSAPDGAGTPAPLAEVVAWLDRLWEPVRVNLQGSAGLFAVVLVFFLLQLSKLRSLLAAPDPPVDRVIRHEQLLDLCINLCFGIGVIWTAIGMRDALLFALGDPDGAAARGAFSVLQRLVDGGILLALSTTIVGGMGGYLMRVAKSVCLGHQLAVLYLQASRTVTGDGETPVRRGSDTPGCDDFDATEAGERS